MTTAGYPHRIKITQLQPGSTVTDPTGTQDPEEGTWDPEDDPEAPSSDTIYEGNADVQDKGVVLKRDASGQPSETADAIVFLEDETKIYDIQVGMSVEVTWQNQSKSKARIVKVVKFDGSLMLKNL